MNTATMPMPGALRLRSVYALTDPDGSCSLLYDLERGAVLDVPEDLQLHAAPALETGEPDEELLSWLVSEDLLTSEGWAEWGGEAEPAAAFPAPVRWGMGSFHRAESEAHARIDQTSEAEALAAVDLLLKQSAGASRVTFHLGWESAFPGCDLLERIVVEASRRAAAAGREAAFELALDVAAVTPAVAAFLRVSPFHVRLSCGTFPAVGVAGRESWEAVELSLRPLLGEHAERVTVHCRLGGGGRLRDLWSWAKALGVRHLDACRQEGQEGEVPAPLAKREFEGDLLALCDEMCADLRAERVPIDFQPLTRVVGRLMRSELPGAAGPRRGPMADVDSRSGLRGMEPRAVAGLWAGIEEVDGDEGRPCDGCWARYVCSHSALRSSPPAAERLDPSEERCAAWRAEVETGLRLYHRLAQIDPILALRLFDETARVPEDPFLRPAGPAYKVF